MIIPIFNMIIMITAMAVHDDIALWMYVCWSFAVVFAVASKQIKLKIEKRQKEMWEMGEVYFVRSM